MEKSPLMSSPMTDNSRPHAAMLRPRIAAAHLVLMLLFLALGITNANAGVEKFTMELNEKASSYTLPGQQELNLSEIADITGGSAIVVNPTNNKDEVIRTNQSVYHVVPGYSYIKITLNTALADGDKISILSYNPNSSAIWINNSTTKPDSGPSITASTEAGTGVNNRKYYSGEYTVQNGDGIVGSTVIYIWNKDRAYIRSLTITPITYEYTLKANVGGDERVLSTGVVGNQNVVAFFPKIIEKDGQFYTTSESNPYGHTFNAATNSDAKTHTITYALDNNIKGFLEGEKADHAFNANNSTYSDGDYGYVAGRKAGVIAESLPAGQYEYHAYIVGHPNRALILRDLNNGDVNSNTVKDLGVGNGSTVNQEYYQTFSIYGTKRLGVTGYTVDGAKTNQSADFDYAYIKKTGDVIQVTKIGLKKTSITKAVNETETLTVTYTPDNATLQTVKWTSSDTSIAEVDADGKVTAKAIGTAIITATANGGDNVTATCTVFVKGNNSVNDLTVISDDYTFIPSYAFVDDLLYEDGKLIGKGAGSFNELGVTVKNKDRYLAFKVKNQQATIKVTYYQNGDGTTREGYIGTSAGGSELSHDVIGGKGQEKTITATSNAEQVIYVSANDNDLYVKKIQVIYSKHTVTYSVSHGTCDTQNATEPTPAAGVTLPTVTPENGYSFVGWSTNSAAVTADAGKANDVYYPTADITLYAVCIAQAGLKSVEVNGHTLVADNDKTYSYTIGTAWGSNAIPVTITPAPTATAMVGSTTSSSNGQPITVNVSINGDPQTISVSSDNGSSTYYIKVNSASDISASNDAYALQNQTYYEGQRFVGPHITAYISPTAGGANLNSAGSNYGELTTVSQSYTGDIQYSYRFYNGNGNNPVYSSSTGLPSSGCFYAFTPTVSGVLEVAVNILAGHRLIVSDGTNILTRNTDYTTSGITYGSGDAPSADVSGGSIRINVTAGTTYYVYGVNTKMGILGFAHNQYLYVTEDTKTFTLSEDNLNMYAFFTKVNAANTTAHSGSTIYRIKDTTDKVTVKVKGAKSVAAVVVNTASGYRSYTLSEGDTEKGTETITGGETTSTYYAITESGTSVTLAGKGKDLYAYQLVFAKTIPTVISVTKDDKKVSEVTLKNNAGATTYSVTTNSGAEMTVDDTAVSSFATVAYSNGTLTITPTSGNGGSGDIILSQPVYGDYTAASYTLSLTVEKTALTLSIQHGSNDHYTKSINGGSTSYEGSYYKGSDDSYGGSNTAWTVTATDESNAAVSGLTYKYYTDDPSIATVDGSTGAVTIQDNASGTAYITVVFEGNAIYEAAKAQYPITVSDGYDVKLTKDETPKVNQRYEAKDGSDNVLCTMILCGYKYHGDTLFNAKDKWGKIASFVGGDPIRSGAMDGFIQQSQASVDSRNEYNQEIEWYNDSVKKQIKPFSLPVRGAYLKFEPEVNGVLTAYVLQNGDITTATNGDGLPYEIGKAPRAYYWFDQNGFRIEPDTVISKLPLHYGRDYSKDGGATKVFYENGSANHNLIDWYENNAGLLELYEEEGMWPTQAQVNVNLARIMPEPQPVVRYNDGYSIHEKAYVKYVLKVIAGNTYYFFSNVSKVGAAGFNFKPSADGSLTCKAYKDNGDEYNIYVTTNATAQTMNQTTDTEATFKPGENSIVTYKTFTLPRTFKKDTWNTITLPFSLTETQVEKVFGVGTILVTYNGVAHSGGHNTAFFLRHVDQNILAGQPYFIKPTGVDGNGQNLSTVSGEYIGGANNAAITFTNVNCEFKLAAQNYERDTYKGSGTCAFKETELNCVGTLAMTAVKTNDYYINANTGQLVEYTGSGTNINAYRAFLQQPENGSAQVKLAAINYSGLDGVDWEAEATGIMEVLVNDMKVEIAPVNGVYNLNGQKVGDSTKGLPAGLYIVNGKVINIK